MDAEAVVPDETLDLYAGISADPAAVPVRIRVPGDERRIAAFWSYGVSVCVFHCFSDCMAQIPDAEKRIFRTAGNV